MNAALPILSCLGTSLFTGTMICIGLAFGSYWTSLPPDAFLDWFAANSHFIVRTIPVVALPAAIGLFGTLWFVRRERSNRMTWIVGASCFSGIAVLTLGYHLPTNAAFSAGMIAPADVEATLRTWLALHAVRVAFGLAATVCVLIGLRRMPGVPSTSVA